MWVGHVTAAWLWGQSCSGLSLWDSSPAWLPRRGELSSLAFMAVSAVEPEDHGFVTSKLNLSSFKSWVLGIVSQ